MQVIHDSYGCHSPWNALTSRPFPTRRVNFTFVSDRRGADWVKPETCPVACRPPDHLDWQYCWAVTTCSPFDVVRVPYAERSSSSWQWRPIFSRSRSESLLCVPVSCLINEFVFILNETRMRLLSALDDVQHLTFDANASLQLDRNVIFF